MFFRLVFLPVKLLHSKCTHSILFIWLILENLLMFLFGILSFAINWLSWTPLFALHQIPFAHVLAFSSSPVSNLVLSLIYYYVDYLHIAFCVTICRQCLFGIYCIFFVCCWLWTMITIFAVDSNDDFWIWPTKKVHIGHISLMFMGLGFRVCI